MAETIVAPVRMELSMGATARAAAKIAGPALLFLPAGDLLSLDLPFAIGAIVALTKAALIAARLVGDRTILCYNAETLTVRGLLGEATLAWADVADVIVHKASWWDLRVAFTSGSRRNLVVLARRDRRCGPAALYIPIDLLGLDAPARGRLVTRLLMQRAGAPGGDAAGAASPRPLPAGEPAAFDPDAIIARYLAERATPVPEQPSGPMPARRPAFGRKAA